MLAVVLGTTACSDDDNHPSTNILDKPEVTVPDVKESSAVITWKAIGNATAYIYSLNNGSEQSTDQNTIQLTGLEPEKSYTFKVKAQKTGSIYFEDSDYAEITFTTTSEVTVELYFGQYFVHYRCSSYKYKLLRFLWLSM